MAAARDRQRRRVTALILALRGIAAVAVLTTLVGGIPRVAQAALALGLGLWSALLVGGAPPVTWEHRRARARDRRVARRARGDPAARGGCRRAARRHRRRGVGRAGPTSCCSACSRPPCSSAIDGHVAVMAALVESHRAIPALADSRASVLGSIAALIPAAVRLAVPWLVTGAVVRSRPASATGSPAALRRACPALPACLRHSR